MELQAGNCALLEKEGDVQAKGKGDFILVAGDPLNESIVWGGPMVMNTQEEIDIAFLELRNDNFVKGKIPDFVKYNVYNF